MGLDNVVNDLALPNTLRHFDSIPNCWHFGAETVLRWRYIWPASWLVVGLDAHAWLNACAFTIVHM